MAMCQRPLFKKAFQNLNATYHWILLNKMLGHFLAILVAITLDIFDIMLVKLQAGSMAAITSVSHTRHQQAEQTGARLSILQSTPPVQPLQSPPVLGRAQTMTVCDISSHDAQECCCVTK